MKEDIETILSLFEGRCGHQWVGATGGSFGCPLCGDHDGDHHLVSERPVAVQPDDWGCAWGTLKRMSDRLFPPVASAAEKCAVNGTFDEEVAGARFRADPARSAVAAGSTGASKLNRLMEEADGQERCTADMERDEKIL
jgi:hypothetical protein